MFVRISTVNIVTVVVSLRLAVCFFQLPGHVEWESLMVSLSERS